MALFLFPEPVRVLTSALTKFSFIAASPISYTILMPWEANSCVSSFCSPSKCEKASCIHMKMFYTQKSNYGITRSWKECFNINASLVFARKCNCIYLSLAALAFAICANNNKKTNHKILGSACIYSSWISVQCKQVTLKDKKKGGK